MKLIQTLTTLALSFAFATASFAQDDAAAKKEPSPELLEKIKTFGDAIKDRKFERDSEAVGLIDELLQAHEDMHEKTEKEFLKGLEKVFKVKARDPDNLALYKATVAALGEIGGPEASKILRKAWSNKKFDKRKEWAVLQDRILEAIGKTKDPKQSKFLIDTALRSVHDGAKKAAGAAMRHFEEAPIKVRKPMVEALVSEFSRVHDGAQNDNAPDHDNRVRTLRAVSDAWKESLNALTGETFGTAPDWRRWWNKHKNATKKWPNQNGE